MIQFGITLLLIFSDTDMEDIILMVYKQQKQNEFRWWDHGSWLPKPRTVFAIWTIIPKKLFDISSNNMAPKCWLILLINLTFLK